MSETVILCGLKVLQRMKAEEFCDRWFGLDQLPSPERAESRSIRGYRAKCVILLAEVLGANPKTVDKWGSRFENMPEIYESTLAYADAIRIQLNAAPEVLLKLFLEKRSRNEN